LRWLTGSNAGQTTSIENYDKLDRTITIKAEMPLQAGDRFAVYPRCANWQVHHNIIIGCMQPMTVDLLGSEGVNLNDNTVSSPESVG